MSKLFVVDISNIAMRSFHGFNKPNQILTNSAGKLTFLCYGVALCFNKLLNEHSPDQVIIAMDSKGQTFRHDLYPEYKSGRKAIDPDYVAQLPDLYRMIEAYGFKSLSYPATEADDIIGTIAKMSEQYPDQEIVIVSGDKDFFQLVGPKVSILRPENMGHYRVVKEAQVFEKFGCKPEYVVDALAIIGDAADAVPGVAGIGEKGAAGLIQQFGSLEQIYERLPEIKGSLVQKLVKSKSTAFLSKELVKIKTDIPISYSEDEIRVGDVFKRVELQKFFAEMEFHSFLMQSSDLIADVSSL